MKIVAEPWRGNFMGNRGGRIHNPQTKTLLERKWASRRWITCVTQFKNRKRTLMGESYTELFFLDETSAFASGHRPCFECRRRDANQFAELWKHCFGKTGKSMADEMDRVLHTQRIGEKPVLSRYELSKLPDGSMISVAGESYALKEGRVLKWSGQGYTQDGLPEGQLRLLTPLSIVTILEAGYSPQWHESADFVVPDADGACHGDT